MKKALIHTIAPSISRPRFHPGDCPCAPCSPFPAGCATPYYPATGATIADNRYFAFTTATKGQALIVPKGSNAQAFLKGSANQRGFVFFENDEIQIDSDPTLTLPLHNPAVSGNYPQPAAFKYLTIAHGADPAEWRHVAAPSAGSWVLQCISGQWVLVDAGQIPGINQVGISSATLAKGNLLALEEVTPGVFTVKKLQVQHGRVLVGHVDSGTGIVGYKALGLSEGLVHPIGKFADLRFTTLTSCDGAGAEIAGGLEQAVTTGIGAVTDGIRMIYSPSLKRLFKAPAQTFVPLAVFTPGASTVPPAAYEALPGGHGAGSSQTYNFGTVRVDFTMGTTADERYQIGLFRDGVLIAEFDNTAVVDTYGFFYIDTGVTPGAHTYDIRWKKTTGSNAAVIRYSIFQVSTLGY